VDDGTASVTSGALRISNTLSGTGTLSASAGAVVDMIAGADFAGALTGAGTLAIAAASVLNTGASLSATHVTETANLTLKSVSISNMASHAYTITAASGATVTLASSGTGSSFTNAGSLAVAGAGTADVSAPFINAGLVSASAGTLSFIGTVSNTGTIDAASALVTIKTDVSGTGTLDVGATGTLSLLAGAGSGQVVDFLAGTGLLDLTQPLDFAGTISGFGSSDKIDLLNTLETTYTYANHILTVKDGSATVAHLDFAGSSNSFSLTGDTHGGTLITFG
jgi:hypothetical protein